MFEFFIALFGGTYFGHKYAKDKASTAEFDKRQREIQSAYNIGKSRWEAKVVDTKLENEINARLRNDAEFCMSVDNEMRELFGDKYINHIGYPVKKTSLMYLLAKQGKLRTSDASSLGIRIIGARIDSDSDKKRWANEVNFIKWIDSEISKHGIAANLMFKSAATQNCAPVPAGQISVYDGGDFFWDVSSYSTYSEEIKREHRSQDAKLENICGVVVGVIIAVLAIAFAIYALVSI